MKLQKVCGKASIIITNETEEAGLAHGKISLMNIAELCFLLSEWNFAYVLLQIQSADPVCLCD